MTVVSRGFIYRVDSASKVYYKSTLWDVTKYGSKRIKALEARVVAKVRSRVS